MKAHVLDLEMNQPSGKIIQIGIATVDLTTRQIVDRLGIFVNPGEPISTEIVELTGITQEIVDNVGVDLGEALDTVWGRVKTGVHVAWGRDWHLLRMASQDLGRMPDVRWRVVDLKGMAQILGHAIPDGPTRKRVRGLRSAVEAFGLSFFGRQHDALTDAENTAVLMLRFLELCSRAMQVEKLFRRPAEGRSGQS